MKRESTLCMESATKRSQVPSPHHLKSETSKHSSLTRGGLMGLAP